MVRRDDAILFKNAESLPNGITAQVVFRSHIPFGQELIPAGILSVVNISSDHFRQLDVERQFAVFIDFHSEYLLFYRPDTGSDRNSCSSCDFPVLLSCSADNGFFIHCENFTVLHKDLAVTDDCIHIAAVG